MLSLTSVAILRLVHIVVGVFWVGATIFIAGFLMPSVQAAGPAGGPVMQQLVRVRRVPVYMMAAAILSILSGLTLYWHDSMGFRSAAWLGSGPGRTFGLGAVFAIAAAIGGMVVNSPTARRLGALTSAIQAAGTPPSAEQLADVQRLQRRLFTATRVAAVLLLLSTIAMSIARYAI